MSERPRKSTTGRQRQQADEEKKPQSRRRRPTGRGPQTVSPTALAPLLRYAGQHPEASALRPLVARQMLALQATHGNQFVQRAVNAVHRQAAGPINIAHGVPLIPQPTAVSCWAGALAMVVGWRDKKSLPPRMIASRAGMNTTTGYGWSDIRGAVSIWGLRERGPASAMPTHWARLLRSLGPLWIVEVGAPYHAVVLGGMHGDGTPGATEVTLYNPWPPTRGAIEHKTFMDFDKDFGLGAGARAAVVHA